MGCNAATRLCECEEHHSSRFSTRRTGQPNWNQTELPSPRPINDLTGIAELPSELGFDRVTIRPRFRGFILPGTRLLVLPPPSGY